MLKKKLKYSSALNYNISINLLRNKMNRYRNPFTVEEERKIIHYIFRKNGFYRLRGLQFWKELERDELPTRTYQSLHERFRKYIINNIQNPAYGLSIEEQMKLKRIYEDVSRGKKVSTQTVSLPVSYVRTEGNLARNFFEISDSDDSNGEEHSVNNTKKNRSSRNQERTRSSNSTNILRHQETNRTTEIEIDSSSESEVFDLQTDENNELAVASN